MSSNNLINQTPGLRRVEEKYPTPPAVPNLATKVTGRNLAALSLIISLEAERRGVRLGVTAVFNTDGSLEGILVHDEEQGDVLLTPGQYVVLLHDAEQASVVDESLYRHLFREA